MSSYDFHGCFMEVHGMIVIILSPESYGSSFEADDLVGKAKLLIREITN